MSKQRIFEVYLNVAEWGVGVFGIQAAAQHYYGISAQKLSADQAAKLASMLPRPRFYDKNRNAKGLIRKSQLIARRMNSAELP
jgi:monofunctional biosynthetic peptidoglycan transglycosylase